MTADDQKDTIAKEASPPRPTKLPGHFDMNRYFPNVRQIEFRPDAGPEDTMVFKHYNRAEIINGKPMEEWFRFSICYFNSFRYKGGDNHYGDRTHQRHRDWEDRSGYRYDFGGAGHASSGSTWHESNAVAGPRDAARQPDTNASPGEGNPVPPAPRKAKHDIEHYVERTKAAFEFFFKMGVRFYNVSDRDLSPEFDNYDETCRHLDEMVNMVVDLQKQSHCRPLYFSADLFSHPRYANGGASSSDANVAAYAAAQVKKALDVAKRLNAENFVFFHPRDGYQHPHMRHWIKDMTHLAALYRMAVQYKDKIGYHGQFLIQPKPHDPKRHQYECDAMAVMHMLRAFNLEKHFKLYIKPAYASMLGRTYEHDVFMASAFNMLGMIDASDSHREVSGTSDLHSRDSRWATYVMKIVMEQGGLQKGGFVLGGRLRRESIEPMDLFTGHILTMDTYARAMKSAARMLSDGIFTRNLQQRYISWKSEFGDRLSQGGCTLEDCEAHVKKIGEPKPDSLRYEHYDSMFNFYVWPMYGHGRPGGPSFDGPGYGGGPGFGPGGPGGPGGQGCPGGPGGPGGSPYGPAFDGGPGFCGGPGFGGDQPYGRRPSFRGRPDGPGGPGGPGGQGGPGGPGGPGFAGPGGPGYGGPGYGPGYGRPGYGSNTPGTPGSHHGFPGGPPFPGGFDRPGSRCHFDGPDNFERERMCRERDFERHGPPGAGYTTPQPPF